MNTSTNNATDPTDSRDAAPSTVLHQNRVVEHPQNRRTTNLKDPKNQTPTRQKQHLPSPPSIKVPKTLTNISNLKKSKPLLSSTLPSAGLFRSAIYDPSG